MALKYREKRWAFLRQENAFVDAARNVAAARTDSDYLFFLDADDLIPPHAIERMLAAAAISGVDCLVSGSMLFAGDEPFRTTAKYMPLGANLVAGLIEPIIYGGPMILIRRTAFEAIGGYRAVRGAAHEDWELQARLAMEGFDTDVLPEYLCINTANCRTGWQRLPTAFSRSAASSIPTKTSFPGSECMGWRAWCSLCTAAVRNWKARFVRTFPSNCGCGYTSASRKCWSR